MICPTNILSFGNLLADVGGTYWMPPQASKDAVQVDNLFYGIYYLCVFFFLLITVLMFYFAWRYRYREGIVQPPAPSHNTALELTWTIIPTLIVLVIFYFGFIGYLHLSVPPPDSYEVDVTARSWAYSFSYPNGAVAGELHVPVNTPILFSMTSDDVIHGFYLPSFRLKKDVVPGRFNKIWIQALKPGTYDIWCTQYCGQDHSSMRNKLIVEDSTAFNTWVNGLKGGNLTPVEHGKYIWQNLGCNGCHTIDGSASGKAPTWKDLYGSNVPLQDGTSPVADENFLYEVIRNANCKPMVGYQPIMPTTVGLLEDQDIHHVISFIKSISKNGKTKK